MYCPLCSSIKGQYSCVELYYIPVQDPLCTVLSVLVSNASIDVLSYILHTYTGSLMYCLLCFGIKGEYRCLCVELYYIPIQDPLCTVLSVLVSKASIDVPVLSCFSSEPSVSLWGVLVLLSTTNKQTTF